MKKRHPLRLSLEVLTLLLVIATLWLSWETRQSMTRQIRVQTWLEMEKRFDSREMDRSTARLAKQLDPYVSTNRDIMDTQILELFDDLGQLYKKGMIDKDLTESSFGYDITHWWAASEVYVQDVRKAEGNDPTLFDGFEYLAKEFQAKDGKIREGDVKAFLRSQKVTYE